MAARGYGATGFSSTSRGSVRIRASENWTDTAQGTAVVLATTPPGTTTNLEQFIVDGNGNTNILGKLTVGTTGVTALSTVHTSTESSTVQSEHHDLYMSGGVEGAGITFRTARGTKATPTAVQTNDLIGFIGARGYGATGFSAQARGSIRVRATENWTDAAQGTSVTIATTAAGTTTNTDRLTLDGTGNMLLNSTSGGARIYFGSSTSSPSLHVGTGSPEGVHTAVQGSLFVRTDGAASTTLYVKVGAGNTGWNPLN